MPKKIVFMGTPEFAVPTLEVLSKSKYKIECVYTKPPKRSSRGKKIKSTPIQVAAEKLNLKLKSPTTLNNVEELEYFKSIDPFIVIVVAYGQIIPKKYLNIPEKGFINIHASLLPKWRGAAPIQRSIINQDKETGISFMKIEEGLDTGPYLNQIKVSIKKETTTKSLSYELAKLGSDNILKCLNSIEKNEAEFTKQDLSQVTYAKKILKSESKINWNDQAEKILSMINGLNPFPGAWFEFKGIRYKIWNAKVSESTGKLGMVLNENLVVGCADKSIEILEIQREGKNKLSAKAFLTGNNISEGDLLI